MVVGFGQAEITPTEGKIPIAGSLRVRYTSVVHDPIFAVAIVIRQGAKQLYIVSCDICHPNKRLCEDVLSFLQKSGKKIQKEEFILCGTHATPYCYVTEDEPLDNGVDANVSEGLELPKLRNLIAQGVLKAISEAEENAAPCSMEFGEGDVLTGFCRRILYRDDSAVMYGDPHREDYLRPEYPDGGSSQYLYFYREGDHKLLGIFAAVPSPAQADESSVYITADYWGVVRNRIFAKYGSDVKVLGVCRAAGELSPHRMLQFNGGKCGKEWGPQVAKRVGYLVADSIIREQEQPIQVYAPKDLDLTYLQEQIDFPIRYPSEAQIQSTEKYFNTPENFEESGKAKDLGKHILNSYIQKLLQSGKHFYAAPVTAWKIADILFFSAPMELFTEYAEQIAMAFPENPVFDIQLANDCIGYLPTEEAIAHGGYSTGIFSALSSPEGGKLFVETVRKMLKEIQ